MRSVRADADAQEVLEESLILLRSDHRRQSLSLDEPLCRDLKLPQIPLSKIGTESVIECAAGILHISGISLRWLRYTTTLVPAVPR